MRHLIIGCGSIGMRHLRNLISLGETDIAVVETDYKRRQLISSEYNTIHIFPDFSKCWDYSPDSVLIATPTSSHIDLALQAAEKGYNIFIEKPLSHDMTKVDHLIKVIKENNLISLVGCNLRFHPGPLKVKNLIDAGKIGKITSAQVQFGQWLPDWHPHSDYRTSYSSQKELGGGIILDAIHEIDYIRWLINSTVDQICCFCDKLTDLDIDTEDTAAIILKFANNIIGEVHLDYVQREYSRTCKIIGHKGTITWDYNDNSVRCYSPYSKDQDEYYLAESLDVNQMYLSEMKHWMNCIMRIEPPEQDVNSAKHALEIALAAKESSLYNKVISIPSEKL